MQHYETLRFVADPEGQARKVKALNWLAERGWYVVSETIEPGHMKGEQACCLASICLPCGFLAGHTSHVTVVNVGRSAPGNFEWPISSTEEHEHVWVELDDNRTICERCGEV